MFRSRHADRANQLFADQFEPDGGAYLYRRSMRGAPVPVTAVERDAFVANYLALGLLIGGVLLESPWIWNAPARALKRRTAVGGERSRAEVRRTVQQRTTWGQLAGTAALGAYGWWHLAHGHDVMNGWGRLWLAGGAALAAALAWRAWTKWRLEAGSG